MNQFSLAVAKIELWFDGPQDSVCGAIGTGFFYKHNSHSHLVTNWHNVTGVNPETGDLLDKKNGLIPNRVRIHCKSWADESKSAVKSSFFDQNLYSDDKALWFEHSRRKDVDVVVLPFAEPNFDWANTYINEVDQEPRLGVYAGMDCYILGFPKDLSGPALTPIWKRGSIAAEPHRLHPFYIDSATRKGMSGSPVVVRHNGFHGFSDASLSGDDMFGTVERFVAIYSSRIGDDELGAQLGRAWPCELLDDIFTLSTPGSHPKL